MGTDIYAEEVKEKKNTHTGNQKKEGGGTRAVDERMPKGKNKYKK